MRLGSLSSRPFDEAKLVERSRVQARSFMIRASGTRDE